MARPKGAKDERPWTAALRKALAQRVKEDGRQKLEHVAEQCVDAAIGGDVSAIKEIGDRLDGKAPQAQIHQGDANSPIQHKVVHTFEAAI